MARDIRPAEVPEASKYLHLSLMEYVPAISPNLSAPTHLEPIVTLVEGARGAGLRYAISAPVQHGKSTTLHHCVALTLLKRPDTCFIYATYGQQFSEHNSRAIRDLYLESGGKIAPDHNRIQEWRTPQGGGLLATSVDGAGTGYKAHIAIVDDPFKNREEAESIERRALVERWMRGTILTRLPPGGSVIIVASRWHEDDLSGRMISQGWSELCIEAINTGKDPRRAVGEALCPWGPDPNEPRTIEFLNAMRDERTGVGEYDFQSLFQGNPVSRSGRLFEGIRTFTGDIQIVRYALGFDLAYSSGAKSDFIVGVALGETLSGDYVVLDVWRSQRAIDEVEMEVRAWAARWPEPEARAQYVSGLEAGVIRLLARSEQNDGDPPRLMIAALPAQYSKRVRAMPTSKAWRQGRIRVRADAPWYQTFVREVTRFNGYDDRHDDQVDALVAAFDMLAGSSVTTGGQRFAYGSRRSV